MPCDTSRRSGEQTYGAPTFFGAREFCNRCHQCAEACPSGSVPSGEMTDSGPTPSNNPGVLKWYVNPETCLAFWRANGVSLCQLHRQLSLQPAW